MFSRIGLVLAIAFVVAAPAVAQFSPARSFPSSWDRVQVFVDQLPDLTSAQAQFAATHYAGTQKQTAGQADAIRAYNSNFIMLQYRLGTRDSGETVEFIHNNTWTSDWASITPHEDWFVHDSQGNRVYQQYYSVKEYVMDIGGLINGNTTAGWKEFWGNATLADVASSHADGVFADSSALPYNIPAEFYDSHMGAPPHTNYIDDQEAWYAYEYQTYTAANRYFIPNIGSLITTLDTTQGYYTNVHGAMVEGFGTKSSNSDWKLQANRTLQLIRNGKIYIAQSNVNGVADTAGRMWLLSNFLLLRHDRSYIDITGVSSTEMKWLPEFDLDIGQPLSKTAPASIDNLRDASGLYLRGYDKGLVLVNPTGGSLTMSLSPDRPHILVTPYGGGGVLADGSVAPGGLTHRYLASSITLGAWSGAVLVDSLPGDANADGKVDLADYAIWFNNIGSGTTWDQGDFNGDGTADLTDYATWYNHLGATQTVPEPASIAAFAFVGATLLSRRSPREKRD